MSKKRVVIVGAGPGGLVSAAILAKRGFDVTVVEKADRVGGRNAELKVGPYSFDTGPTFLHQKFTLDEVFAETGRNASDYLDFVKLDPMTKLTWQNGTSLETTFDVEKMAKNIEGAINLTLFPDDTPVTCANFLNLASRGYYNGLKFHRVIPDFMVQGGCPLGTGTGDPGYKFEDECKPHRKHDKPGILSMANAGPNTNGSQFFITHVPTPWLDGKHTVFGEVTEGQDVVNAIQGGDEITTIDIHGSTDELFEGQKDRIADWNSTMG